MPELVLEGRALRNFVLAIPVACCSLAGIGLATGAHRQRSVQVTITHGCYRSVLKQLSDFKWLAESPPDEWHSLLMRHAEVDTLAVERLGRLSRVL
eukprot:4915967-Amphidinium_carterae.1